METRFALALQHFEQALERLRQVVALPEDDIVRDSMIKRFEFSFEAGWKAAYRWLRARGIDADEAAYAVIPLAFKQRLIVDEAGWGAMRKARNQTAHTYDPELARQVAAFTRVSALGLLTDLLKVLKERADE
ncbi:MAG: HI0074 family nucleotidyltransferase substrate-binding subunit [Serpentinimonas sp.]|nr:HI0074 family nucleotidyltransferase substrate-binding subunit [Serpentinimonas sp.]